MVWSRSQWAAVAALVFAGCAFGDGSMDAADSGGKDGGRSDAAPMDAESADRGASTDADPADAETSDAEAEDAEVADAAPDAETDAGQTGPRVQVGTGSAQFEPLVAGQRIEFTPGFQGGGRILGFHIWTAARIWELNPQAASIDFIVLAADRTEMGRSHWDTNFMPTATDAYEIWGGTPRLADCCPMISQPLIMRVEVLDADGVSAAGEIEVLGDDACIDPTAGDVCQ